jgi:HEAT repeat protein
LLADGDLLFETTERPWSPSVLVTAMRLTLAVLKALPCASELPAALGDVASGDPIAGVRTHCLSQLITEAADHPATAALLEAALADPSDAVRVVAAAALGERGVPVLREILVRTDSEEEPAARAVGLLGRSLSVEQVFAILDSALGHGRRLVAAAAVEQLARAGGAPECQRLQALLCGDDVGLAAVAADALAEAPSTVAEPVLLSALDTALLRVRPAIARALGRVGGVATLRELHTMLERSDPGPDLAAASRQAIAAIQARLPGAAAGQVSLAESTSGALSLAEQDAGGRLSLPHKPASE